MDANLQYQLAQAMQLAQVTPMDVYQKHGYSPKTGNMGVDLQTIQQSGEAIAVPPVPVPPGGGYKTGGSNNALVNEAGLRRALAARGASKAEIDRQILRYRMSTGLK